MSLNAGRLRHRIVFQALGTTQDPKTGEEVKGWITVWDRVWASVEPLSTNALIAAQAAQSDASARIVIRYRNGVLPTMRILFRGEVYSIKGQPLPDTVSGLEYLTILVSKGVLNG
ncbi:MULTISPECIES: phage head closure protein [Pseudomonas]|uniref:Phage related protein n=1 Tax=Pseudomonas syringae pv. antirrhini TaxID=251702 RepID=A0A0P9J9Y0_9PSED|nr:MULTISPECIES: phage head closure protein [Pseudomonas]KPW43772.1 Phage related protein [Pseudomonas syringae pv. antirrhini]RMP40322.1 Phage related protein [Pseudomonas syringae pv. antirrhini]RMP43347.1 Phage related protein [Pseudomonas syringae pv. antirrhini]RMW27492.1 Phage related protein [Pseudomonas syringae pv. antirrhini]WIN05152.1 phage head closure protein [Pseudomonas syringae pv. antirrhini str. 126]